MNCSRNTVRRYLREPEAVTYSPRAPRPTKLDPFEPYLLERIATARPDWIPATVLLRELRERGYDGGYSQIKAFVARHRPQPAEDPVVRFETEPGQQMQADFTVIRRGRDPLLAFVATLGYSRASFVRFSAREDSPAWCSGLEHAFDYFGGVPRTVLFDNAKTVCHGSAYTGHFRVGVIRPAEAGGGAGRSRHIPASVESAYIGHGGVGISRPVRSRHIPASRGP